MHEPRLEGTRLLVVDDSIDACEVIGVMLQFEGASVHLAHEGQAALAALRGQEVDLVVSDLEMPGLDGYGFIEALRRQPGRDRLPAIALTGRGSEEDVRRALEAGFDAHVTKPVVLDDLVATIARLLPR